MSGARRTGKRSFRRTPVGVSEHLDAWRRGLRHLTDRGTLLCVLGERLEPLLAAALREKGGPVDDGAVAATVLKLAQGILEAGPRLDAQTSGVGGVRHRSRAAPADARQRAARQVGATESFLEGRDLSTAWCPVVWVGSKDVCGEWVSLALGAGIDGVRRVLALRSGSVRDADVARGLIADLAARGLPSASGVLVVTAGSRTLDKCVERGWGHRAILAHCRQRVLDEVISHVAEPERSVVHAQLKGAWSLPSDEGRALLGDLVERLERSAPGAAERLARSLEATLVVDLLGVTGPLKERLTTMGTCGMAFNRAQQWKGTADAGIQGLAAGLKVWLGRTRRLMGWQALGPLAAVLQRTVAAATPAPRS